MPCSAPVRYRLSARCARNCNPSKVGHVNGGSHNALCQCDLAKALSWVRASRRNASQQNHQTDACGVEREPIRRGSGHL